jgi:hypothetical protein
VTTPPMMEAAGGSGSLKVTAQPECSWNASSTAAWISGIAPASAQGTADLTFRVAANDGAAARDGEIAVNDARVRVSQRAPCRYDVSPSNQGMNSAGGAGSLTVTTSSDCAWNASSDVSWISLSQPTSGSGNGTIRFTVAANTDGERTGSIAVANQRSIITQAAASTPTTPGCTFSIAPTSQNIAAAGGAGSPVAVSTQSTCRWSATSNTSWLTVTSGTSGTGNGTVGFTAAANTGSARTGTLTIAGNTFTVSQAAAAAPPPPPPSCSYSTPSKVDFGKNGGVKTFNVSTTTGCAWTAVANDSWIVVLPTSGTGNATISVTVPPNTTGKDRSGSITVAGRTVTVNEDH